MSSPQSWGIIEHRLLALIQDAPTSGRSRIPSASCVLRQWLPLRLAMLKQRLAEVLTAVRRSAGALDDAAESIGTLGSRGVLRRNYVSAPPPTMPALLRTLDKAEQEYEEATDDVSNREFPLDSGQILHWASVIKVVAIAIPAYCFSWVSQNPITESGDNLQSL